MEKVEETRECNSLSYRYPPATRPVRPMTLCEEELFQGICIKTNYYSYPEGHSLRVLLMRRVDVICYNDLGRTTLQFHCPISCSYYILPINNSLKSRKIEKLQFQISKSLLGNAFQLNFRFTEMSVRNCHSLILFLVWLATCSVESFYDDLAEAESVCMLWIWINMGFLCFVSRSCRNGGAGIP